MKENHSQWSFLIIAAASIVGPVLRLSVEKAETWLAARRARKGKQGGGK